MIWVENPIAEKPHNFPLYSQVSGTVKPLFTFVENSGEELSTKPSIGFYFSWLEDWKRDCRRFFDAFIILMMCIFQYTCTMFAFSPFPVFQFMAPSTTLVLITHINHVFFPSYSESHFYNVYKVSSMLLF